MRPDRTIVCLLPLLLALPASAATVAATDSIWLAAQPSGATVTGYFGSDAAPANSPLQVNISGHYVRFSAAGSTSVDGSCFAG